MFLRKYDLDGNEQWTRQFGTTSEDRGLGPVVDTSGVYLTGYTYGALPGYANAGPRDAFVRKYDLDGNELWTRQFGTTGEDMGIEVAVDTGGLYLTGGTMGALPGQSSAGEWDVLVRKYDLNGNEQWTRQFGSISEDWGPGVAVDTGGLYVTGYTAGALPGQSSAGGLDAWVRRYDLDGNEQWTRQFGTTSDDSSAEVVVDAVEAYLVGDTMGTLPGQSSAGSGDVFLRKYDLDGNEQWTRQFGTSSHDSAQDMTMDTSGVYLTGHTRGAFPGQTHAGAKDVWVRHYDRDGIEQWTLQFGTNADDWGLGVATDTTGGMYLTGPTRGALPGHGNAGGLDVFVRKYHPNAIPAPPLCGGKPATIVGTEGDDDLRGTDGDDVIVGLGGDDLIKGRGGNDTLCGNAGKDTLVGGPGDDVLRGGGAYDRAGYSLAPTGVTVDLESGVATGWGTDKLVSIEFVLGSAFDDNLFGDGSRNFLRGGDGDDLLIGRGGPDWLRGDSGDDDLRGTGGNDTVDGWDGNDTLDGGNGDDLIRGMAGADRLIGGSGDDRLEGRYGSDTLIGGPGDDRLDGGIGSDWVAYGTAPIDGGVGVKVNLDTGTATGGHGTDELRSIENIIGSRFNDELYGTDASNVIKGNDGQDWISGHAVATTSSAAPTMTTCGEGKATTCSKATVGATTWMADRAMTSSGAGQTVTPPCQAAATTPSTEAPAGTPFATSTPHVGLWSTLGLVPQQGSATTPSPRSRMPGVRNTTMSSSATASTTSCVDGPATMYFGAEEATTTSRAMKVTMPSTAATATTCSTPGKATTASTAGPAMTTSTAVPASTPSTVAPTTTNAPEAKSTSRAR